MLGDVDLIKRLADAGNVTTILEFSSLALLIWDWLITLDTEIKHVWPTRWSFGKLLFFLTRYLPLSDLGLAIIRLQLSNPDDDKVVCRNQYLAIVWLDILGIGVAQIILGLRTWAIYNRNKWVFLSIFIFLMLEGAFGGYAVTKFVESIVWAGPDLGLAGIPGCNIVEVDSRLVGGAYVGVMIFEAAIFIATMAKALKRWKGDSAPLINVVFRDGLIFYLLVACVSILNVVVIYVTPEEYTVCLPIFQRVMHSVATARILLHMRETTRVSRIHVGSSGHPEMWVMEEMNGIHYTRSAVEQTTTIMQQLETHIGAEEWFEHENSHR